MLCADSRDGMFCWKCYVGLRGRRGYKGHRRACGTSVAERKGPWLMALKKPEASAASTSLSPSVASTEWAILWPSLWEFLTAATWDDGSKRRLPTLLLFWEEGLWKSCLSDRDQGRTGWSSGPSPEALMTSLDAQLRDDRVEWRKARPVAGGRR